MSWNSLTSRGVAPPLKRTRPNPECSPSYQQDARKPKSLRDRPFKSSFSRPARSSNSLLKTLQISDAATVPAVRPARLNGAAARRRDAFSGFMRPGQAAKTILTAFVRLHQCLAGDAKGTILRNIAAIVLVDGCQRQRFTGAHFG